MPSGKRPDAVNWGEKVVGELKPDNPRAKKRGMKQLEGYRKELEEITRELWKIRLDTYKK